jgi:uncharacterized protein
VGNPDDSIIGRGWGFPPTFDKRLKGVEMVSGADDIEQSLLILFSTNPGDRLLLPTYGCDVQRFLFQSVDVTTLTELKDTLSTAILNWEPRIRLNGIELDAQRYLEGVLLISLDYTVRATNSRSNRVFPLYLQEGTNLDR